MRNTCALCDKEIAPGNERKALDLGQTDRWVYVGPDCYKRIKAAGPEGYKDLVPMPDDEEST